MMVRMAEKKKSNAYHETQAGEMTQGGGDHAWYACDALKK